MNPIIRLILMARENGSKCSDIDWIKVRREYNYATEEAQFLDISDIFWDDTGFYNPTGFYEAIKIAKTNISSDHMVDYG